MVIYFLGGFWVLVSPREGFEPSTYRLTAERSTTELTGQMNSLNWAWERFKGMGMIFCLWDGCPFFNPEALWN